MGITLNPEPKRVAKTTSGVSSPGKGHVKSGGKKTKGASSAGRMVTTTFNVVGAGNKS